ncbi:protein-L-isoaspartate O-methyltransferase [Roseomonas sp. SSH11]|uniref:Protein-L-isoaspartate O-methyltransferase n=1 Tax=Pararoseomonas baculiformis TaxID=2820812 RepID=A0ABS4AAF6_9PROT|nr:protein-L-isoaspartate O-methyltransferase [Pararoseomonas baculiformis]MBP0443987.1 protein-L-isoaspartate O-methyltransferase [Pararoseomonas baculiformis]
MDYAEARRRMVDGQIRPNRVTDPRILEALRDVPRELFVPQALRVRALADEDLALGGGRVLLQPMIIARMIQLALPRPGERVLVVASGPGYGAAIMAHVGAQVVAVEDEPGLAAMGDAGIAASGLPAGGLRRQHGSSAAGLPEGAPYDLIFIEGAVPAVPPALSGQLSEGGRLVAIMRQPHEVGSAVLGRRVAGVFSTAKAFDIPGTQLPLLPDFTPKPGFALR